MTLDSCGCNPPPPSLPPSPLLTHSPPSTPSQHNQAFIVICIWTNRCSRLCLCLHISHERFALFFPPHPSSKTPTHNTYALNSAEGFIVTASVLPVHGGHVCDSLVNKKKKNPKAESPCCKKWWNTAWGRHMGIHWLQLSLGDWQNKLLNPLLRSHVTKHTCYGSNGCSAYHKYHSGARWDQWTYKSGWKTINPSVVENSSIILAWDCCVIPLSESHITSKQKGIMEDNLSWVISTWVCLTFSNLQR